MLDKNTFSYSKISTAQMCYEKYKLQWILDITAEGLKSSDLAFGTALHTGVAAYLYGNEGIDVFTKAWQALDLREYQWYEFDWDAYYEIGCTLLEKFNKYHKKHYKPVLIEERQYGLIGAVKYEGTPDFVGEYKGVPSLIDFKTTKYRYEKSKIEVADQLYSYCHLLIQNNVYTPKQIILLPFCKTTMSIQDPLIKSVTKESIHDKVENMKLWIGDLQKRTIFPQNHNSCILGKRKCEFFDRCHKK